MKKNVGFVIVLVAIFLVGVIIFVKTNNVSNDIILPAEEIIVQDGISIEDHRFTPDE